MASSSPRIIGAIDIGSNAMRAAAATIEKDQLKIISSIRCMVSLGRCVFANPQRQIDKKTLLNSNEAFLTFLDFFKKNNVQTFKAVGTSALRDASNAEDLIDLGANLGIGIMPISGDEEARLIRLAVTHKVDVSKKIAGLFDIGGGSAEFSLLKNGNTVFCVSEKVGTIRLLRAISDQRIGMDRFAERVRRIINGLSVNIKQKLTSQTLDILIGTGGNIEELGRLRTKIIPGKKKSDKIRIEELEKVIELLEPLSLEERQEKFGFRADRADVILPAAIVLREVMLKSDSKVVRIPGVGLKEGLLLDQFNELGL